MSLGIADLASLESWAAEANVEAMMVAMATAAVQRFCRVVVISFFLLLELRCEATPLLFVTIRLFARADGEVFVLRMLLLWYLN